ncbi:TatD family hydrolase [Methylophilaceae bacterium]|jgi:TatD DNase family protein|nr:TatD family hydrolase [Methylophilaceae bacterium]
MWIDSHCHLDFFPDTIIKKTIKSARNSQISNIVIPSVSPENLTRVREIAVQDDTLSYALGFHPMYIDKINNSDLVKLSDSVRNNSPVAIGEIGIDLFIKKNNIDKQEHFLVSQLKLAIDYDLPVILHTRNAIDVVLKHLRRHKVRGGIAHAFNGSNQQAYQFIDLGFKLGFGGAMTYPRAKHIQKLAKELPIESIVLETDSPDMPPFWLEKDQKNQPKELEKIGIFLAQLRGLDPYKMAKTISKNTLEILPKIDKLYT